MEALWANVFEKQSWQKKMWIFPVGLLLAPIGPSSCCEMVAMPGRSKTSWSVRKGVQMLLWKVRFILAKEQTEMRKWKTRQNLKKQRRKKTQRRNPTASKRTTEPPTRERSYDSHGTQTESCSAAPWRESADESWVLGRKEAETTET